MEDRFETFTYLVMKISKQIQRIKNIEMSDLGLKAVHVMCLYHLSKHEHGLTSSALVEYTLEDKAAVSRALSLLKKKNLINYDGGYNALATLTPEGISTAKYIEEKSNSALKACGKDLTDLDRDNLYTSLNKIENNIESYYEEISKKL